MRVKCESCAAGYTLPESKLKPGRRVQFACRRCGNRIVVAVPAGDAVANRVGGRGAAQERAEAGSARQSQPAARPHSSQQETGGARRGPRRDPLGMRLATGGDQKAAPEIKWFVANQDGSYRKLATSLVGAGIRAGEIGPEVLLWRKGWAEWKAAGEAPEWSKHLGDAQALARDGTTTSRPSQDTAESEPVEAEQAVDAQAPVTATRLVTLAARPTREAAAAPQAEAPQEAAAEAVAEAVAEAIAEPVPAPAAGPVPAPADAEAEPGPDQQTSTPWAADSAPQRVVSSSIGRTDPKQKAVSLPIVRAKEVEQPSARRRASGLRSRRQTAAPGQPRPAGSGGRFAPRRPPSGTPIDGRAELGEGSDSSWAPATDTYIGPRDRFTRRIGSEEQRMELLARVEREHSLLRQLRLWQWIALGCACAAIFAFGLTVYMLIELRLTAGDHDSYRAHSKRAPAVAPVLPAETD